ncbi:uncharacterized protein LOC127850288 isoform X2 [Dreissena polymorpha]|uniref:L-ascorbate oxidase n=1 Tax=Dreissena polymorpha TaxID=45954 RepID=A0A9D4HYA7_DREPO|nr:uncharacterized protein LOC127850288 isoform X1 [Dreissena polymorpha]XP_052239171.1 uncharacterized protein LOC127850288 isoform X2 [Dreissena polymorpha]KAH3735401.1 hypothetical protein DPMN_041928 [Dreissena polymorpha]
MVNIALQGCIWMSMCMASLKAQFDVQPHATSADTVCKDLETVCTVTLVIEHKLTMILEKDKDLIYAYNGELYSSQRSRKLGPVETREVITADGASSRLVITINGQFPGPRIETYVDQTLKVKIVNKLHTDSVTVHFHGIHQKGTPWMDGVAFISQCPILPGQSFEHVFKAYPPGTSMYHAHIGDQRSMGLYGAFIVYPRKDPAIIGLHQIVALLQDWNHLMDPETAYQRMLTEQFDFTTRRVINTTYSVDRARFSRFEFQSGLINGKGRYWLTANNHNGSPLTRFQITSGVTYRFRIIGAMTIYPMRVFIEGQTFIVRGSDAYDIERREFQSLIIHPGERYDILWTSPNNPSKRQYMFVAETIETRASHDKYHAAEAILEIVDYNAATDLFPNKASDVNCNYINCTILNCPYQYESPTTLTKCITFNDIKNNDPIREPDKVLGNRVDNEYFFNFGFPGRNGNTPGSVNAREFVFPSVSMLTQPNEVTTGCDEAKCSRDGMCECTYTQKIPSNKLIQMVFSNIGNGAGWSHPIHLHGHSFYVMKMGLGSYNRLNGYLVGPNTDINCTDSFGYCSTMRWNNESWNDGNIPGMNDDPPQKDTIVVPTGGYVVVRFISDNPGVWLLHCHVDLHNTNGMGMVIDEGDTKPTTPIGFPVCRSFEFKGFPTTNETETTINQSDQTKTDTGTSSGTRFIFGVENILTIVVLSIWNETEL